MTQPHEYFGIGVHRRSAPSPVAAAAALVQPPWATVPQPTPPLHWTTLLILSTRGSKAKCHGWLCRQLARSPHSHHALTTHLLERAAGAACEQEGQADERDKCEACVDRHPGSCPPGQ
jgi:hypothetical protein